MPGEDRRGIRRLRGAAPWNYSEAALNVDALIGVDYVFLWAAFGLALETLPRQSHREISLLGSRARPKAVPGLTLRGRVGVGLASLALKLDRLLLLAFGFLGLTPSG